MDNVYEVFTTPRDVTGLQVGPVKDLLFQFWQRALALTLGGSSCCCSLSAHCHQLSNHCIIYP